MVANSDKQPCYNCGSRELKYEGSFVDRSHRYTLWKCMMCDIVQLHERLSEHEMQESEDTNPWYQCDAASDVDARVSEHSFIIDLINKYHQYIDGDRLLEIGCSHGYKLEAARRVGYHVEGVELSSLSCKFAKEILRLRVHCGSIESYIADDQFNIVVAWHVIEHTPSVRSFLKCVNRALRPNGLFLVQVPSYEQYKKLKNWDTYTENFCAVHYWYFTGPSLCKQLNEYGLEPVYTHDDNRLRHLTVVAKKTRCLQ